MLFGSFSNDRYTSDTLLRMHPQTVQRVLFLVKFWLIEVSLCLRTWIQVRCTRQMPSRQSKRSLLWTCYFRSSSFIWAWFNNNLLRQQIEVVCALADALYKHNWNHIFLKEFWLFEVSLHSKGRFRSNSLLKCTLGSQNILL